MIKLNGFLSENRSKIGTESEYEYWKAFKLGLSSSRGYQDADGQRENNEERSARSRVGLISHYPDRWCIIPILWRVTGSAAARSWPLLCPGKNSNLPGSRNEKKKEGKKKKWRKMERKRGGVERWRKKKKTSRGGWRSSRLR